MAAQVDGCVQGRVRGAVGLRWALDTLAFVDPFLYQNKVLFYNCVGIKMNVLTLYIKMFC